MNLPGVKPASATWLIFFEDCDKPTEIFVGDGAEKAARARFKEAGLAWSCHLFASESAVAQAFAAGVQQGMARAAYIVRNRNIITGAQGEMLSKDILAFADAMNSTAPK